MKCSDLNDALLADMVLDRAGAENVSEELAAHLASCPECRRRASEVKAIFSALEAEGGGEVPAATDAAVAAALAELKNPAGPPAAPGDFVAALRKNAAILGAAAASLLVGFILGLSAAQPGSPVPGAAPLPARQTGRKEIVPGVPAETAARLRAEAEALKSTLAAAQAENRSFRGELLLAKTAAETLELQARAGESSRAALEAELVKATDAAKWAKEGLEASVTGRDKLAARVGELERELDLRRSELLEARDLAFRLERDAVVLKRAMESARLEREALAARCGELMASATVRGDANGDGAADVADSMKILGAASSGLACPFSPALDMNGDNKIDVADAMLIARRSMDATR